MNAIPAFLDRARENIKVAELLIKGDSLDIAASRAYYAMFYIAEALLLSRSLSYSSHSAVIAAYGKEFARNKTLDPKFHRYLIDAQETRQIGDYGVETHVPKAEAVQMIQWAREFLKAAESYLGMQ
ncbi:MAG: HEPN domain-containing protein [Anaerolineales bacterium]|nr:HEPN domain-containing protein [Anaerolineales bacterium]